MIILIDGIFQWVEDGIYKFEIITTSINKVLA